MFQKQKLILLVTVIFIFKNNVIAQTNRVENATKTNLQNSFTETEKINEAQIYKVEKIQLSHFATPNVELKNIVTKPINQSYDKTKLPTTTNPIVNITMERKQAFAIVSIPQYVVNEQGNIVKIISYDLQVNEDNTPQQKTTGNRTYANNSVLATGNWYKIAIANQGIYKIDFDFIKNSLGVDPSTINSNNIRLYGNGGEVLPESNTIIPNDDLVENAIQVVDGGDGKIDAGDYILFYANGPHTIINDSANKQFSHSFNFYNTQSFYFLNFDMGVGKRIALANNPTTSDTTVTSFNEMQFYEQDLFNFGHYGKEWWGDELNDLPGRDLTKTITFSVPDVDINTPVNITTRVGAISHVATSTISVNTNGNAIGNAYLTSFGYEFGDPWIKENTLSNSFTTNSVAIATTFTLTKNASDAAGYINYLRLNARRNLVFHGYLNFADWSSVRAGNITNYQLQNTTANTQVWDISNPLLPTKMNATLNGTTLSFNQEASTLHRFVALDGSVVGSPTFIEKTANQNLHNTAPIDYIVIAHPNFLSEAYRLANYHANKRGYKTLVVTPQTIYNEFSSGSQDVSAIRNFLKMMYDKAPTIEQAPSNVLFFGDASYDYKNRIANNTNYVPTFETLESNNKTTGYCTDDFFGFLDDNENINNFDGVQINTLDIGVGRIPCFTQSSATDVVNKILNYDSPNSFGPWKNNLTFNADNADGVSLSHFADAEAVSGVAKDSLPIYNQTKIYVDGVVIQSTPAGPRAPDANATVREQLFNGTFLMNYNGHGGPGSWCEERIFSKDDIGSLKNYNKLPLFITATCDFAPFDNPSTVSAGEILITKADGGAIALMTTTQLVYADQNLIMNRNYINAGFEKMQNGKMPTLGDAYRLSKNLKYKSYTDSWSAPNFRKFALLGDPGLPLAFPMHTIKTDSINGVSTLLQSDTFKALNKYTIVGHIEDKQGNFKSDFNGVAFVSIYDKPKKLATLQYNDAPKAEYTVQNNIIYKGKATVKNGKFSMTFIVPKDINYEIAKGKISYYAQSETEDAAGYDAEQYVGGSSSNSIVDNVGPTIKPFMNNEKFVDGGIVNANSNLFLKLSDDNGINYSGNSVGHDITAVLDDNSQKTYILNNFFEADIDDYRSGKVTFPVSNLSVGKHSFTIKAWDIVNNSAEARLNFEVVDNTAGLLNHVYNYPNPFSTHTQFMFEHNMPNQNLYVGIQIFTITGKIVRNIKQVINTDGYRVNNIDWDGMDEYGDKLANGTYIYKLSVKSSSGFSDSKMQKLVIIR